jgi:lipid II isoglutaminyl synthase (glutamine-hydrolysing)
MHRLQDAAAVFAARSARLASKITRSGQGSSLPGLVVEKVSPGFMGRRAAAIPGGVVLVSGTNGKTTTASMIRTILRAQGDPTIGNDTGANLRQGIASALLDPPQGAKTAVFEVDEATLVNVVPVLRPRLLVLTNVFRDQLDRFGEIERVVELLRGSCELLPPESDVVANVDDPLLWPAVEDRRPVGFGVSVKRKQDETPSPGVEAEVCPRCGKRLVYESRTIAHLGQASCPNGDWHSSQPAHLARVTDRRGLRGVSMTIDGLSLDLGTGGVHNAYNVAAAVAVAERLGISPARSVEALRSFRPRFGRAEELTVEGRSIWLALMKNPGAADALIGEIADDPQVGSVVVAVNDASADGRDISWIWDVDFERLATAGLPLVPSGTRSSDVAVRLKYADGKPGPEKGHALEAIEAALAVCPPERSPVILATYTAMLDVRSQVGGKTSRLTDVPA